MSRVTPDGVILDWRLAGLKQALANNLPFFIQWNVPDDLHPGQLEVDHPAGNVRLEDTTIWGHAAHVARLEEWAPQPVDLTYAEGESRVTFRLVSGP
jgi:hypothetical protein